MKTTEVYFKITIIKKTKDTTSHIPEVQKTPSRILKNNKQHPDTYTAFKLIKAKMKRKS